MHPHGHSVGWANYPQWFARLYPFRDRPDISIPVLFYAVPEDAPHTPPTVFCPRWYEAIDGWVRLPDEVGVGTPDIGRPKRTDRREWVVAPGGYNVPAFGPVEGTPDQWARGTLYSEFLAGAYGPMAGCVHTGGEAAWTDADALLVGGGRNEGVSLVWSDPDTFEVDVDVASEDSPVWTDAETFDCEGEASAPSGPGATCATAGLLPLGVATTYTVPMMGDQWWYFPVTAGTTYRCRYAHVSGDTSNGATLLKGSCPTPGLVGPLPVPLCQQFTAASGETAYVRVTGGFIGSTTYTLTPDAGTCP